MEGRMISRMLSRTAVPDPDYSTVELTWSNLKCQVVSAKDPTLTLDILKGVSGYARPGHITSIMGPSGAGKTTMMDILAGRTTKGMKITGELMVNGKPTNVRVLKKSMSYVMQQDNLPHTETVRECLHFNAALRLPKGMTRAERAERVEATLKELGLVNCADTLIGSHAHGIKGISGGQMRRLSVAQELITSPSCIFLDEPTSGLDSEIAVTILQTLASLASRGRTIMLTIHQPNSDITELFDDYILMARGYIVYAGEWSSAMSFFSQAGYVCPQFKNPTDYFMRVVANDEAAAITLTAQHEANWEATKVSRKEAQEERKAAAPTEGLVAVDVGSRMRLLAPGGADKGSVSWMVQAYHLTARNFRMWRRHPLMIGGEGIQYCFLSLFVGGMYFGMSSKADLGAYERGAGLFYILVTIVFTPPFTAVTIYNSERGLLRRETNQHTYGLTAFYVSKTLTLFPMEAMGTMIVSVVSYYMFGLQRDTAKFFAFFVTMFLSLLIAESLGLIMAMVTKTAELAIVSMSLVFIVVLSFTGFLTPETPVYYKWLQNLSFLRYGNAALFINEMEGLVLYAKDGTPVPGDLILVGHPLNSGLSLWSNVAVLAGFLMFLRITGLVGLHVAKSRGWM